MSIESPSNQPESIESADLTYSIDNRENEPGKTFYLFKDVVIIVDTSGKNYNKLPEVGFATAQGGKKRYSMERVAGGENNVHMDRVVECIRKVAEDQGYEKLWFYPFGEESERKHVSEQARARLFSRFSDIEPEETGYGYVVKL